MSRSRHDTSSCDALTVRFPNGMLDQARAYAERNDRSLNAEIVHALRQWLKAQGLAEAKESHELVSA